MIIHDRYKRDFTTIGKTRVDIGDEGIQFTDGNVQRVGRLMGIFQLNNKHYLQLSTGESKEEKFVMVADDCKVMR